MTGILRACILPPDLILQLAREAPPEQRIAMLEALEIDHSFRQRRAEAAARQAALAPPAGTGPPGETPNRIVHDQQNSTAAAPGKVVRGEGDPPVADQAINEAYDIFGATYNLYWNAFQRNSIDDRGMPIQGLVHFGSGYDNAFWDGTAHMFFGDGDGQLLAGQPRVSRSSATN